METTCIEHANRGGNLVALFRVEAAGFEPAFIVYFRIEHGGGARVEQWTRTSPDRGQAVELYQRGLEDFIEPIPFVPSSPAHEAV